MGKNFLTADQIYSKIVSGHVEQAFERVRQATWRICYFKLLVQGVAKNK